LKKFVNLKVIIFGAVATKTKDIMKGLKLSNSIYASKMMAGSGLDVKGGRLINNRPDGVSGIVQAAEARKAMKHMKKIEMYSDAVALGNMKSEMMEEKY
jgi:hypothetical protein